MRLLRWLLLALALTGAAPAFGQAAGVSPSQMFGCNRAVFYDASTSGATRLVQADATGGQIYVCGYHFLGGGTVNVGLIYGTGGTCGTGTTKITPAYNLVAQTYVIDHLPVYTGMVPVPAGNDLCINTSAAVAVQAYVYYTQFP